MCEVTIQLCAFYGSFYHIFRDNQLHVHIKILDCLKCLTHTRYPISKFLKSSHAENLLHVLLNAISCTNGRKIIILSTDGKEKEKGEK